MATSKVVLTVVVLNYHHRTAETHVMPMWVRKTYLFPWCSLFRESNLRDPCFIQEWTFYFTISVLPHRMESISSRSESNNLKLSATCSVMYWQWLGIIHNSLIFQVKSVFLQWLPWIFRMSRPGKKITRKTITMNSKMNELQLKEKSWKSLLANVLDMDDDLR